MKKEKIDALILAAGKGTRMRSSTPKVLHEVCGVPLIYYALDTVVSLGISNIVVVVGHSKELIEQEVCSYFPNISFVTQKVLNGSAKAVEAGISRLKGEHVFILCADSPLWDVHCARKMLHAHLQSRSDATILSQNVSKPDGLGRIVKDLSGDFLAIREEIDAADEEKEITEINTGIYLFRKDALLQNIKKIQKNPKKQEFFFTDIFPILLSQDKKISVFCSAKACFFSVNTMQDLLTAQECVRVKLFECFSGRGIRIVDPESTFLTPLTFIGENTTIYPFAFLEKNVKIGKSCAVGPFVHLREGTILEDRASLGNFTESVRSRIGERVKMRHFSYVGDAVIGNDVNIGAGTVIANFDGTKKNKTVIGKGAFIGSDSVLVAPVKIGEKSITGAGCVVTKDVPPKSTVVGVPARILKRSHARKKT